MDERRYYGLDALRGTMMMLGIVLHAATNYIAAPPPHFPITSDRNTSLAMDAIFDLIHSFRMPTFFVLAGFFAALLVEKRGLWGTYRNRVARILMPLLAGFVTVLPVSLLFMADFILSVRFGTHDIIPDRAHVAILKEEVAAMGVPSGVVLAHLWFLYYLLYFYLLIPVCEWLRPRASGFIASPRSGAVFVLMTAAALWPYPGGQVFGWFLFLKPWIPGLVYYGLFFVLGYLFRGEQGFVQRLGKNVAWYAAAATVLFPASLYASRLEYADASGGIAYHVLAVGLHACCTWALIYLSIGCAMRFFDRSSPWILYTSQSSYWVFLLHLPVVSIVCWMLVPYDVPAEIKFLVVTGITTVVCFTTYHYWVQRTWVSAFLNGKRFDLDWPWRKPVAAHAVTP